jgi:hypothetical protein
MKHKRTHRHDDEDYRIISFLTIRKAIGILGISLPAVLLLGTFVFSDCGAIENTISHYYFTLMGDVFVGIICAISFFLILYNGYDKWDNFSCGLAGLFALGVAFFPTSASEDTKCAIIELRESDARYYTHYISAALFFITLACISLFLFTKGKALKTPEKIKRNMIYRICGIVILVSVLLIFMRPDDFMDDWKPTFWLEWIALAAFSVSWLVKGEVVLKDKHHPKNTH